MFAPQVKFTAKIPPKDRQLQAKMPPQKGKIMKKIIINLVLLLFLSVTLFAQGTTQYIYDANGRLTHVISPSGQVSVYEYDFAGNLTRIRNEQNSILLISSFSPVSGAIGSQVTIRGIGFSIIPAQNEVKFNGVSATVLSSTPTELTVTVPIGASTGKIQVTNSLGTVNSSANFVITPSMPIINSFSPILGKTDDVVTINGSGYSSDTEENFVKFYQTNAQVLSAGSNQITTKVPNNVVSGKIKVSNNIGEAVSNDYFFVVPDTFIVSDVSQTVKLNYDEKYQVSIPKTKKLSLFVFEGTAGDRVHVSLKNISGAPNLIVRTPSNGIIWNWYNSADLILPESGTYSVSINSADELPVSLSLTVAKDRKINTDGTSETAYLLNVGQDIELNFQATANQNFTLRIFDASAVAANFSIISPSGQTIYNNYIDSIFTGSFATFSTTETGNHKIVYDPVGNVTGSASFELNLLNEINDNLIINDPVKTFTSTTAGQGFRITFAGSAEQRFYLRTSTKDFYDLNFTIKNPDGTELASFPQIDSNRAIDINKLPQTGNYTLIIYPNFSHQFGNLQLQAIDNNVTILNDASKSIHSYFVAPFIGGGFDKKATTKKATIANLPTATYLLNANADDQFSFTPQEPPSQINDGKKAIQRNFVKGTMTIYKPNGDELSSVPLNTGFCNLTLPDTGEYRIVVAPEAIQGSIINSPQSNVNFILRVNCGSSPDKTSRPIIKKGGKK
jgi:YD repeat-containing protein